MKGHKTSYVSMFTTISPKMGAVELVEIPLIQRDYAQGRQDPDVKIIRRDFLDVLTGAATGGDAVDLDFVYGEIIDGVLRPLDGQQRLTTLFLIHWYVAASLGRLDQASPWLQLSYATRHTAELFCRRLVDPVNTPAAGFDPPSAWIRDQPWYLLGWRHDPTIRSMLVMVDEIHNRLGEEDLERVWERLVDAVDPPITFHFLAIDDLPSGEELYIKMNSRGRPLTEFENFKARFERILNGALPNERFNEIVHKIDGAWTDLLWHHDDGDQVVDDEFLRYLEFIIQISEWRGGLPSDGLLLERAERVFGGGAPLHVDFLIHAFDTWFDFEDQRPIRTDDVFSEHFVTPADMGDMRGDQVVLHEAASSNLFSQCCRTYGQKSGGFSLSEVLLLFAILIHRQHQTSDVQVRLRRLRNLTDLADEVREEHMPTLIESAEELMRTGNLEGLRGFNAERLRDESLKQEFLASHSDLLDVIHRLEDHRLLRGRLYAFDLDYDALEPRSVAFEEVTREERWPLLTGAMLAVGNYGIRTGYDGYRLGSPEQLVPWRTIFTQRPRELNTELRRVLNIVLDRVAESSAPTGEVLRAIMTEFVDERRKERFFDWRYYLVAYDEMREGSTGVYRSERIGASGHFGYTIAMLRTNTMSGLPYYRDPFLYAIWKASGAQESSPDPWFRSWLPEPRWLRLRKSEAGIRSVREGVELARPLDEKAALLFEQICAQHGASVDFLRVPQIEKGGEAIDTEDRVQIGAALLRDLAAAGL